MTLRRKLVLWYSGVLAVSGLALILGIYLFTAHQLRREAEKFLGDEVDELVRLCRGHEGSPETLEQILRDEVAGERYFPLGCRIYDPVQRRNVVLVVRPNWRDAFLADIDAATLEKGPSTSVVSLGNPRKELRLLTVRLNPEDSSSLILQGGIFLEQLNKRLSALRLYLAGAFAGMLVLAAAGGMFLAGRSLKPIDEIIAELERIKSEDLAFRLPMTATRDEISRLRAAVNGMLARLDEAFTKVSEFTADAAHELRTPLAALQCRLEVALSKARTPEEYRQASDDALAAANRLTRMVNDLLFLARMDADSGPRPMESVRLVDLLDDVREVFGILAEERDIRFATDCPADITVQGDAPLLRRLVGNLVDNALRHTPKGGTVTVRVRSENGNCVLQVADTGPGIPVDVRERIFDRFFRLDTDRSHQGGAGLGLSICKRVVELHGGTIRTLPRAEGGAVFEARIPAR